MKELCPQTFDGRNIPVFGDNVLNKIGDRVVYDCSSLCHFGNCMICGIIKLSPEVNSQFLFVWNYLTDEVNLLEMQPFNTEGVKNLSLDLCNHIIRGMICIDKWWYSFAWDYIDCKYFSSSYGPA